MPLVRLTMLGRPGCHLCDDARAIVAEIVTEYPGTTFEERSIQDEAELTERYAEEIPVLMIDDRVHTIWKVDPVRLRAALEAATAEVRA